MLLKIIYIIILSVVAWFLTPFLTASVSFIPLTEMIDWLIAQMRDIAAQDDGQAQPISFYVLAAIWTIVLGLLLSFIYKMLSGIVGGTRRFAERKEYRHTQFFVVQSVIFIFPAIVIFLALQLHDEFFIRALFATMEKRDPNAVEIFFPENVSLKRRKEERFEIFKEVLDSPEIEDVLLRKTFLDSKNRLRTSATFFSFHWYYIFAVCLLFTLVFNFFINTHLAPIYEKLIRFIESGRFGYGGSGRFAGLLEEVNSRLKKHRGGLFYGRSLYAPWMYIGAKDDRHMLTFAGSRSGKGATCIIPNLLLWEGSAFVVDPKGTAAHVTGKHRRQKFNQRTYHIDPFLIVNDETDCFNPLEHLDPKSATIVEEIGQITEALIISEKDSRNQHFIDSAKSLIGGYIAQAISDEEIENPSLVTVYHMLSYEPQKADRLHAKMMMNEGVGGIAKRAAMRVLQGGNSNEFKSVQSTALEQTYWLSSLSMQRVLQSSTFRFEELKERPTTVYLVIPPQYLDIHKRFLRLFINIGLTRFPIGGRAKIPTLFILDEAHSLGRMEEISRAYGLLAGYNMIVWAFFQDKGQLDRLYGDEASSFISSSRAVQIFSVTDEATVDFASNMLGKRALADNFIRANEAIELRTPGDVRLDIEKDTERQYILRSGRAPFILERVKYWQSFQFKKRAGSDPDY